MAKNTLGAAFVHSLLLLSAPLFFLSGCGSASNSAGDSVLAGTNAEASAEAWNLGELRGTYRVKFKKNFFSSEDADVYIVQLKKAENEKSYDYFAISFILDGRFYSGERYLPSIKQKLEDGKYSWTHWYWDDKHDDWTVEWDKSGNLTKVRVERLSKNALGLPSTTIKDGSVIGRVE